MTFFNKVKQWTFYIDDIFSYSGNLSVNNDLYIGNVYLNNNWINDTSGIKFSDGTTLTTATISNPNQNETIIFSVKKTIPQTFASGGVAKITGWDIPHVDIGTTGWSNANSRYTIQRTGTYRIYLKTIVANKGNEQSELRYLNIGMLIYNSGGGSPVIQDLDTTTLVNVDNTTGKTERGSGDYSIIRTFNAGQYIEFQVGSLEATGNYVIESGVFNIEEVGASYVAGVSEFLSLTGGTVYGNITINGLLTANGLKTDNPVHIGTNSGATNQGTDSLAIGNQAGKNNQSEFALALGTEAGKNFQKSFAIAIGKEAGRENQFLNCIAIGTNAGQNNQSTSSIAIGNQAGLDGQGSNCVAIGKQAGDTRQPNNTIILNATGNALNTTATNGFYVAPIATETTSNYLYYDISTNQITYGDMHLSMLQDGEVFKKTSDNKLGSSNLFVYYSDVGANIHVMETRIGTTSLSRITSTNTIDNKHILTLEPRAGGSRYFELHDDNSNLFIKTIGSTFNIDNEIRIQSSTNNNYYTLINSSVSDTSLYTKIQGVNPGVGDFHHLDIVNYNRVSIECLTSPNLNNRGVFLSGPTVNINGTYYNSSDDRLKDNESPITNVYDKISSLNVLQYTKYTYDPNTGDRTGEGKHEYGLIAQDLLNTDLSFAVSELVDDCYYSVAYQNLFCLNLEATKQLIQQVTTLSAEVDRLKERIITLESR